MGRVDAMVRLRPATLADADFLYRLLVASMKDYVAATWGWDEEFQKEHFRTHFEPQKLQIVLVDGCEIGVLSVEPRDGELWLASIQLLPEYQRRGIGTQIIRDVLARGRQQEARVTLQVLKVNPARSLYERLGFCVIGETKTHFLLESKNGG